MLKLFSTVVEGPKLNLEVKRVPFDQDQELKPNEVIVEIKAAPINPSDIGVLLMGGFRPTALKEIAGTDGQATLELTSTVDAANKYLSASVGKSVPPGNEGAGTVIKAGEKAKALIGKVVGIRGQSYGQFVKTKASACIVHNEGTTPAEAAASFVNPATVLCMIETMSREKHNSIVHTAAASALGQMLQKACNEDGIALINIVRKQEQEDILREIGAKYVIRSDKETFMKDLVAAMIETKATLAFDAIGGGEMANILLTAMEKAAKEWDKTDLSIYGTAVHKQVYMYGRLASEPTVLKGGYGMSYSVGGYLMPRELEKVDPKKVGMMFKRIADGIKTTFKTTYHKEISLADAVTQANFMGYTKQETGKKYLINPSS